jgi:hypothetical protein
MSNSTFPTVVGAAPENPNSDFKSPAWHEAVKREVEGRPTAFLNRTPEAEQAEFCQRLRDAAREKGRRLDDEEVAAIHAQVHSEFS